MKDISIDNKIREWLDCLIWMNENLKEKEDFDEDISTCYSYDSTIHIFKGLEKIAFYIGATIIYNPHWDSCGKKGKMSFRYRGYEVFQLWTLSR